MTDEELCRIAAEGDLSAEEMLVARYSRLVRACARPFFLLGGDSEDLIQEGMIGLLKAIREYRSSRAASFRTFAEVCIRSRLYTVLRSAAGDRQSPLNQSLPLDTLFFDETPYAVDASQVSCTNPEEIVIGKESANDLWEKIRQQLSDFEAAVLQLYLEGLSYQEISQKVHRSPKAVDNAVQRMRRKIAQQFNPGDISSR